MRSMESPRVVQVLDRIRVQVERKDIHGDYQEFCWFAREYPRCYRFHLDGADHRLRSLHSAVTDLHRELSANLQSQAPDAFESSLANFRVRCVYWDFEAYLSEINIALDLLARVIGPAFATQTAPSFNRFCAKADGRPLSQLFLQAKRRWVSRLKDYRDCFTHYTPVDTLLMVVLRRYGDAWELRVKLPVNPNAREILGFRFTRRMELVRYAIAVHRHMTALDRAVARHIRKLHRLGLFPQRTSSLFFVGRRAR